MTPIVPLVEGHGEVEAVPILIRRVLALYEEYGIEVAKPFRVKRNQVIRPGELERAIIQAIRNREGPEAVVVLLDADDDLPCELGPELLARARVVTQLPVFVVLARMEYECWLLGSKESLRGVRGIREDATSLAQPEDVRGAKWHLSQNMVNGRTYLPADDQAALTTSLDLSAARRRCPSLDKLIRDLGSLLGAD